MTTSSLLEQLAAVERGAVLVMTRKGFTGYLDRRFDLVVVRTTRTRCIVSQNRYVDKRTGELKPKYLNYITTVESIRIKEGY